MKLSPNKLPVQTAYLRAMIALAVLALAFTGCSRQAYRLRADRDAYRLLKSRQFDARWEIPNRTVEANPESRMAAAIKSLLMSTHEKEDFRITIPLDLLEQRKATQRIFNFVLGGIAAISLLVGGIGIMNIMLATVSERTGEIGIRRALGATQSDITLQFLIETLVLSASGAILGAAVGLAAPPIISFFSGRETAITLWAPMVAVGVAMATGLIFGIYPAKRAAALDPIEALRRV